MQEILAIAIARAPHGSSTHRAAVLKIPTCIILAPPRSSRTPTCCTAVLKFQTCVIHRRCSPWSQPIAPPCSTSPTCVTNSRRLRPHPTRRHNLGPHEPSSAKRNFAPHAATGNLMNIVPAMIRTAFLSLVLAIPLLLPAQSLKDFEKKVTEFTISNGMHFIVVVRHDAP